MSHSHNQLLPAVAVHPGEILKETLEERGMTQRELAEKIGRPPQLVSGIINGHKGITAETALDLADVFGTSPELWLKLDTAYRLTRAQQERQRRKAR